jgi:tetratricopeptide (TPR) repeat protein
MRLLRHATWLLPAAFFALGIPRTAASGPATWVELKSPAFSVVSDGGEKDARYVAQQFEQVRALLKEVWPWARLDPSRPITILAARDEDSLKQLLPGFWEQKGRAHPAGIFVKAPDRSWVAVRTDVARFREADAEWNNPFLVVFHEYVHLVLHLNFAELPVWLDEGLADFWGNSIIEEKHVYIGYHIPYHLATLRERGVLPLSRLFVVDHGSPEYSENNRATTFYAESWALVHYLAFGVQVPPGQRSQLNQLVGLLKAGTAPREAQQQVFGDPAALTRAFEYYVGQQSFRYRRRDLALQTSDDSWTSRTLARGEALAVRAQLHAALGRATEARALAGEALALDPGTAAAHEALAVVAVREKKPDEALSSLARAVELPGASDYGQFLYGRLQWQKAQDEASLERAERAFSRAVEMNTSYADAYDALASVMAERGAPLPKCLPLAIRAAQLEPGVIEHSITAIRLAARGGAIDEARQKAELLLGRASAEDRPKLEALLEELKAPAKPGP